MKKRIFILCLAVCLLFTLSSVCAGDVNDTAVASEDVDQTADGEILSAEASDDVAGVSSDDNVISSENRDWYVNASAADGGDGSSNTPYNSFKSVLNNVNLQDGDSVYFAGGENYAGENNVNLDINKQLNLLKYGSGDAVFDAEKKSRIFKIIASCINITGLTFINGNADYGAAIYFSYGISNSNIDATYINNNATHDGGANYFFSTVSNSNITGTYINNTAEFGGGNSFNDAFSNSNIAGTYNCNTANNGAANYLNWEVSNSNIGGAYNNNTAFRGGANFFNSAVSNSNITGAYDSNSAESNGGANYFYSSVSGSNIMGMYANNTAEYEGGANYFNLEVSNSNITGTYTGNRVNGPGSFDGGGANYFNDAVSGSNITGMYAHNAATYGGAIRFDKDIANSNIQATYINNTAECGGAIYFRGASKNVEITGIYINNTATYGAVMEFMGNLTDVTISNAVFLNNRYDETIGIISAEKTGAAAKNNWFGNNATNYETEPKTTNIQMDSWLFLNGTYNQNNIKFFLMSYNGTATSEYDNTLLPKVNLTLTATNVTLDKDYALLNEKIHCSPENGTVTAQIEDVVLTTEVKNGDFDILQDFISSATSSVINLTRNYTYGEGDTLTEGVLIDKNVTINGNGFTIDAKGKSRIFKVTAGSINITNVILKNGKADKGGAIYFENVISNSNISAIYINNTADYGGANYFNIEVSNSNISGTYSYNNATHDGGANYFFSTVSNSNITGTYINNTAEFGGANSFNDAFSNSNIIGTYTENTAAKGGANYLNWEVSNSNISGTYNNNTAFHGGANLFNNAVSNSNITGAYDSNSAESNGGANYFYSSVSGSNIMGMYANNTAEYEGGANYFNLEVSNSNITGTYTGNRVNGLGSFDGGGANYFNQEVSGSNITGMYADNAATYGGAIRFDKDITNSNILGTYINNTAECGGAIYFRGASKNVEITGIYINNTATYGAVMEFMDNLTDVTISNAIFLNNRYDETIGIISAEKTGTAARNNWFGNNATNYGIGPKTAGIQMDSWLFLNATNNQNNITFFLVSYDGTATGEYDNTLLPEINLTITTKDGILDKSIAGLNETVKFSPTESGIGRVTAQMEGASQTVEVKNGDFDILQAIISSATSPVINLTRNYTYNDWDTIVDGVLIDRPVTINGNGFAIDAKGKSRIFKVTAGSINITNIIFKNGNATEYGGAIYFENAISNSNINAAYINNTAEYGGANYFSGELNNVNLTGNFTANSVKENGGANYFNKELRNVDLTGNFINNSAERDAGANFFYDDLTNVALTGNFTGNSAYMYGGANHFQNHLSNVVLMGNFINNSVSLLYGGANYILGDLTNVALMGNFINNSATDAGANYIGGELENVNMTCNFINNSAKRDGGANYFFNKFRNVNMTCNFINNSAGNNSGANYFERELRNVIITGNYINNTGKDVIRISNSVSGNVIRDSIFINNAPIVVESGSVSAIDVWFGNNATNYDVKPDAGNGIVLSKWLFLNATAPDAIFAADTINISFKLSSYDGENVSAYDNSRLLPVNLTITSTSGSINPEIADLDENITYTPDSAGRGSVTATVENVFCTVEFGIDKSNPDLSVGPQETTYGESVILTVSYNAIATGKVNITLKGKNGNYTFTNLELNATILLAGTINADDYNVTVAYSGDGRFSDANATANMTVKKMGTEFTANAVTATYNINKNLVITLKDAKGNALSGTSVTVDLNGVKTYVTDKNGQIIINVAKLVPKAYTAKITFAGNDNYAASSAALKVTVNKAKAKITAKKKTFKKAKKVKKYTITLKSGKTAIKKVQVTLKIKGKTYKAKTNAKGKATFKIKKLTKKGKFKAKITFKGNKYYKATSKKTKITIK